MATGASRCLGRTVVGDVRRSTLTTNPEVSDGPEGEHAVMKSAFLAPRRLYLRLAQAFVPAPAKEPLRDAADPYMPVPGAYLRDLFDDPIVASYEALPPPAHLSCPLPAASRPRGRASWR